MCIKLQMFLFMLCFHFHYEHSDYFKVVLKGQTDALNWVALYSFDSGHVLYTWCRIFFTLYSAKFGTKKIKHFNLQNIDKIVRQWRVKCFFIFSNNYPQGFHQNSINWELMLLVLKWIYEIHIQCICTADIHFKQMKDHRSNVLN